MDAASNTGVDNIREIIESARYKPMMARYKVYLIDEVHMLSKGAFNALLKTLEEPPGHVKFIFATTEVRKVPLTVLSRCQRFDLRRVDVPVLAEHFRKIVANEGGEAEDEALALIARAAEGSVRDGLSLLDQALAMSAGKVGVERVRDMLGLADRGRIFDLIEKLLGGATAEALEMFAPPAPRRRRAGAGAGRSRRRRAHRRPAPRRWARQRPARACSAEERRRAAALAERLSVAILARAWQMLLKGLEEIARAPNQAAAAEMVLIRLAFTADLPAPADIINALGGAPQRAGSRPRGGRQDREATGGRRRPAREHAARRPTTSRRGEHSLLDDDVGPAEPVAAAMPILRTFADVVAAAGERREAKLKVHLEEHVSLVRFDRGRQHRAASAGRRAQGARQRAAREAQRLDRQALDGGAEQDAGRAPDRRGGARAGRRRGARSQEAPVGGGGAAAVPRRRDHQRASAAGRGEGRHGNWVRW